MRQWTASRRTAGSLILSGLCSLVPGAGAGTLNLSWDNDLLTANDKGYTNGGRLSYLTTAAEAAPDCTWCLPAGARNTLDGLPGIGAADNRHALAFSLRQLMFTPSNIEASEPLYDDLPYAGYLDASVTLWSWNADWITGYGLLLGVVGPDSGARRTQQWAHTLVGSEEPKGWGNQLGQTAIGGLEAYHARRLYRNGLIDAVQSELSWGAGVTASNFISNAETGLVWRVGRNLPRDFIPLSSGASSTIGLPGATDAPGWGWSAFAGIGGQWVPYSYLDQQSGRYTYDQNPFVGQAGLGGGVHWPGGQAALVLKATTSPNRRERDPLTFGTLFLTLRL